MKFLIPLTFLFLAILSITTAHSQRRPYPARPNPRNPDRNNPNCYQDCIKSIYANPELCGESCHGFGLDDPDVGSNPNSGTPDINLGRPVG